MGEGRGNTNTISPLNEAQEKFKQSFALELKKGERNMKDRGEQEGSHAFRGVELHSWSIFNSLSKTDMRLMMFVEMCGVGRCMLLVAAASIAALDLNFVRLEFETWIWEFYLTWKWKRKQQTGLLCVCVWQVKAAGLAMTLWQVKLLS